MKVICSQCGKIENLPKSLANKNKRKFCNRNCYYEWKTGRSLPKEHVNKIKQGLSLMTEGKSRKMMERRKRKLRKIKVCITCNNCGRTKQVIKSVVKESGNYCSKQCWYDFIADWETSRRRGPEWTKVSLKCRKRDGYKCRVCGTPEIKGKELHSHHIVPWGLSRDSGLENLMTVCRSDHKKIEYFTAEFRNSFSRLISPFFA